MWGGDEYFKQVLKDFIPKAKGILKALEFTFKKAHFNENLDLIHKIRGTAASLVLKTITHQVIVVEKMIIQISFFLNWRMNLKNTLND